MKKTILDILKIVLFTSVFSALIAIFPQITLEGALVFMGSLMLIASAFAANAYKSPDRRIFKFLASGRNQNFFSDADQARINRRTSEDAFKKMVISGIILFVLSYFAFYIQ